MPRPTTVLKTFLACPNFLCHTKNWSSYCAGPKHFAPTQKVISICNLVFVPTPLMSCSFTGPKMFGAGPNFLCQTKNLSTYCGSHKHFVPDKKMICIQKNWFLCRHKSFWRGTKCRQIFGLAQKIWTGTKHFGTCKRTRH